MFIYLIGAPGSGKTTLMRHVIQTLSILPSDRILTPPPLKTTILRSSSTLLLGHYLGHTFDGTDTLSYTAQQHVMSSLLDLESCFLVKNVLGEGDRLANPKFIDWASKSHNFRLYFLDTSSSLLKERREYRGSNQNATWLKGRESKVRNLAESFGATRLDGSQSLDILSDALLSGLCR